MDEYEIGKRLRVICTPAHTSSSAGDNPGERSEIDLELEILHAYTPFTTSVVCLVRIISLSTSPPVGGLPETCVLKLYDRRYAINARETFDAGRLYSAAKEAAYQRFLQAAVADPSIEEKTIWQLSEEEDEGGVEAYLERSCQKQYIAEMGAYGDLAELQGTLIPTLYGSVRYRLAAPLPSSSPVGGTPSPIRYGVNGILIEHIPSTTLEAYLTAAMQSDPIPYDYISDVCDQVIKLMDRLDNFKVLNQDCGMRNILVVSDAASQPELSPSSIRPSRCVAIDFAYSRLRFPDETDEQWRRAKENQSEQEVIGCHISQLLASLARARPSETAKAGLWKNVRANRRWYRELSKEEQKAYQTDGHWGLSKAAGQQ